MYQNVFVWVKYGALIEDRVHKTFVRFNWIFNNKILENKINRISNHEILENKISLSQQAKKYQIERETSWQIDEENNTWKIEERHEYK